MKNSRNFPLLPLGALLLAAAAAVAQSNQGGGEQLNPATSANSIANGGSTGAAAPVNKVVVPVTPASPAAEPVTNEAPPKKKLSDRALARKIRGAADSKGVKVSVKRGKVVLTGTAATQDAKDKLDAKAVELAGAGNVVDSLAVKPVSP